MAKRIRRRVRSRLLAVSLGLGCTPEVDPPWLVERPTELALSITVQEQGPFGTREPSDAPRPLHEALPLDTVRIVPFVADRGGPVPLDELSVLWVLCPAIGCVDALAEADRLPACDEEPFDPDRSCRAGTDAALTLGLDAFPDVNSASLFSLAAAPNIAFIASRSDGPGAQTCAQRLRVRDPLGPCVMMLRDIELGSLGELVDAARSQGIEIEVTAGSEELLLVPRNHAPLVQSFAVRGSSHGEPDMTVASGSAVEVAIGDEIEIEYLPTEDDFDDFEIEFDGETLSLSETLSGQWWLDRGGQAFSPRDNATQWTVSGAPGTAHVYFVVRDGRGSEAWGWLSFSVRAR